MLDGLDDGLDNVVKQEDDVIHQFQQQAQLPPPSGKSPLRVRITVPKDFNFDNPPASADDGIDEDAEASSEYDHDAEASPDEEYDKNMVNARDLGHASDDLRPVRRSTRHSAHSQASGSEYAQTQSASPDSADLAAHDGRTKTSRGRITNKVSYDESKDKDDVLSYGDDFEDDDVGPKRPRKNGTAPSRSRSRRVERDLPDFIEIDPEESRRTTRLQERRAQEQERRKNEPQKLIASNANRSPRQRTTRNSRRRGVVASSDDEYAEDDGDDDDDDDDPHSDAVHTTPSPPPEQPDADGEPEVEDDGPPRRITRGRAPRKRKASDEDEDEGAARYPLRPRGKVDYRIPLPFEDLPFDPKDRATTPRQRPRARAGPSVGFGPLPFPPRPGDDSDSDGFTRTPRRPLGAGAANGGLFNAAGTAGSMFHSDLAAAAGTPSNLGRLGAPDAAALADIDPLGVNQNITFDDVGGLDEHVASLKEMTLLPLLYPELFQRFNVTPPRGVLFHGPPGTGKTLLARALAASCRSGGKNIAFFMRKGADCLSKWVGEAERQLRLLFEEARNSQPSIIFFDEIDGLAPVRSSKQDQIHASIVSTLLALMDGMDGRGQVIVIGATNRPDAIDPALRRPGRFDREFYFPLPNVAAREKILKIHTKGWEGWRSDDSRSEDTIRGLARITKGYGGADLRALCTEAALNAVQRRYPQIYQSTDRLVVKPETVRIEARDFMISIKKMVPSSARSASSTAAPLPQQLVPLLDETLKQIKTVLDRVIPQPIKRSVLEEAQWEDDVPGGETGALDREMLLQSMETLRIHRPRLVLHGPPGMGQSYLGAAALHHLEAFNVQSLDLGALMSDSTRTVEAAIVQLFVEAKRNHPSIIYIPSLLGWSAAVSETARTTVRSMLDALSPTDPILLLAVVDGSWNEVPRDVRSWFGLGKGSRIALDAPVAARREAFFAELMKHVRRPPTEFPDAVKRRRRVLEDLPIAPPLAPRQPTEAELRILEENDLRTIAQLKHRLNPVLLELKRRFKRFTKAAEQEYGTDDRGNLLYTPPPYLVQMQEQPIDAPIPSSPTPNGVVPIVIDSEEAEAAPVVNGVETLPQDSLVGDALAVESNEVVPPAPHPPPPPPPVPEAISEPIMHLIDLERIHVALYSSKYLTPFEFLEDVHKIVQNADNMKHYDSERFFRAQALYTTAEVHVHEFEAGFLQECNRMAPRERKRRDDYKKARAEAKKALQDAAASQLAAAPTLSQSAPAGTRRSARNNGLEPELTITDPVELERRLKRQRSTSASGGEAAAGSGDNEGRASKRVRTSGDDEVASDVFGPVPVQSSVTEAMDIDLVAGSSSNAMLAPESVLVPSFSAASSSIVNGNTLNSLSSSQTLIPTQALPQSLLQDSGSNVDVAMEQGPETGKDATPLPPPPPRTPSPSPGPPPAFILDEALAKAFELKLVHQTSGLNVEELEHLRAACFDCVWRHRSEWERDKAVHEMDGIVDEFLAELEEYRESDRDPN